MSHPCLKRDLNVPTCRAPVGRCSKNGLEVGMTFARKGILYATAAFALAFALAPVNGARADVIYNYEGADLALNAHDPFKTTDKVIGTITFATPLAANLKLQSVAADVVSFSFTAGVETMNSTIYNP